MSQGLEALQSFLDDGGKLLALRLSRGLKPLERRLKDSHDGFVAAVFGKRRGGLENAGKGQEFGHAPGPNGTRIGLFELRLQGKKPLKCLSVHGRNGLGGRRLTQN